MVDIKEGLPSIAYKFFDKNISGKTLRNENISNQKLAGELHKLIIRQFKKKQSSHLL